MRRDGSMKLAVSLAVSLGALVSNGCCKRYVQIEVEPCPPMSEEMLEHLKVEDLDVRNPDDLADVYVADEIIPYCDGIEAIPDDG